MFLLSHRNVILSTRGGDETRFIPRDFLGDVPDRFCASPYFEALVKDGKIAIPKSGKDKDVADAGEDSEDRLKETVKRVRKPKEKE